MIKPYNVTLNQMSVVCRRQWAAGVVAALTERVRAGDTIIFIAGKNYRRSVADELRTRGLCVRVPLEGLGIGLQLQALKRMTEERGR